MSVIARFLVTVSFGAVGACSAAPTPPAETAAGTLRAHPSNRAMTHAFERIQDEAVRCLRPGDRVTVRGAFTGAAGGFEVSAVEALGAGVPYAVETCVRVAAGRAHVRPFRDERAAFSFAFGAPEAATSNAGTAASSAGTMTPPGPSTGGTYATGTLTIGSRPSPADLIRREADALQRCYEQACERDQTIAGTVELHFTLDATGRITRISSRLDTPSPNQDITLMELVARCIESHVRLIQFGPQQFPNQETVVPLSFQPGGVPID